MSMTNEQIQALKAAAESCGKQEPLSLVVYHGKMCLRNKGGIVFTVLRDICFPEYSAENENYARLAELCTSDSILSLLSERDADKALIAELNAELDSYHERLVWRINDAHEWERKAINNFEECGKMSQRIAELEARTLTVKLPQPEQWSICEVLLDKKKVIAAIREACAAAGITLVVGE